MCVHPNMPVKGIRDFVALAKAQPGRINYARLRCLGATSSTRTPLLPDVPTIAEQGIKGFSSYNWNGVLAPANTPKTIVSRIHEVIAKQLKTPEAQETKNRSSSYLVTPVSSPL